MVFPGLQTQLYVLTVLGSRTLGFVNRLTVGREWVRATDNTSSHLNRVTTKTEPKGGRWRMRPLSLSLHPSLPSNCDDDDAAKWLKMDGSAGVELGGLVGKEARRGKTGKPGISFRADDFFPIG